MADINTIAQQFTTYYYQTFDASKDRSGLAGLYVSSIIVRVVGRFLFIDLGGFGRIDGGGGRWIGALYGDQNSEEREEAEKEKAKAKAKVKVIIRNTRNGTSAMMPSTLMTTWMKTQILYSLCKHMVINGHQYYLMHVQTDS